MSKESIFFLVFFFIFVFGCQSVQPATVDELQENDRIALKFAFSMEEVGVALYAYGARTFERELFSKVNISLELVNLIATHTQFHARTLGLFYMNTNGAELQAPNCTFSFSSLNSFPKFLGAAVAFESMAASTYYSLIDTAYSKALLRTFASIAAVKSRHSAYLNYAIVDAPFPSTYEPTKNLTDFTSPFGPSCPPVPAPQVLIAIPPSAFDSPSRNPVLSKRAEIDSSFDEVNPTLATLAVNDLQALNLALALNYLELALLDYSLSAFPLTGFVAAGYSAADYANLNILQRQLMTQNQLLKQLTMLLGGEMYKPCTYSFAQITTVAIFTNAAATTFDNSAAILGGLLVRVYDKQQLSLIASLTGVTERYSAFFLKLKNNLPFPSDVEQVASPSEAAGVLQPFTVTCQSPLPAPKLYLIIPQAVESTPTPYQPTQGTCLVSDFRFDASSWSSTPEMNLTSNNSTLMVSGPARNFYFLAPTRYRGDLSAFFANGNGSVSVLYASAIFGNNATGIIIKGGNGFELVYHFMTNSSLYIASFGSGLWAVRPQGSNSTMETTASPADIIGVLTYVQCFFVHGASGLKGFNLCDTAPQDGSDCANRCSGEGRCTPNFPSGPMCSCSFGYTGVDCSTRVRSQTGRFRLPTRVITWNYGL